PSGEWGSGMLIVWAVLMIVFILTAPTAAEEMSASQAHRFVAGKLFEVSCFDGTRALGRIDGDGAVIGSIQLRGTGPERSASLPAGTLKIHGAAVCASLRGIPFEPCFKLDRTSDHSFRGSVVGLGYAYCDFAQVAERQHARADGRSTDGPLSLHPCTWR